MKDDCRQDNDPDSWKAGARDLYLRRKRSLTADRDEIVSQIEMLRRQLSALDRQLDQLDAAAEAFGLLPKPVEMETLQSLLDHETKSQDSYIDYVEFALKQVYPRGMRAAELRRLATQHFGRSFHEKTAGMSLYRLSERGRVRREGFNWFYVPPGLQLALAQEAPRK